MGLQCKPYGKLKSMHTKVENQLLKEKNESKKVKESSKESK